MDDTNAPGWPGGEARWTSSAKSGVGTSLSPASRIWFTLSHGIFNEIYYSRVDQACTRDMGFIVTDGKGFFSEEKRHAYSEVSYLSEGIPAYRLVNTCKQGRYRISKEIITDPVRDVVLQKSVFTALQEASECYHLYVLLSPHLGNRGGGNTAWIGGYKGVPMLFAERDGLALALASSAPWVGRSAGYIGFSDGWQDLSLNKKLTQAYRRAENGNVALTGEIDLKGCKGDLVLALGFGRNHFEAGNRALASLYDGFEQAKKRYIREWSEWHGRLAAHEIPSGARDLYRISCAVLRAHESKRFRGGIIASLSVPWGFAKGDDDLGGYHLAWPRDLAETAGGMLAAGAVNDVRRVLNYLKVTQEADGHWPQNMWLDGSPYWSGLQLDETAFPILLVDMARREKVLGEEEVARYWPMVLRAAAFIVCNGPVTQEDRWEEDPGYSPFTLAVEIAGLLAAAELAGANSEPGIASYLSETADNWNSNIERWTYVTGTDYCREFNIEGYYVRIAPPETADAASPLSGFVPIKNRPPGQSNEPASHIISPDALALVRFGLRAADDRKIVNTVKVIDALLRAEAPYGPAWHRYNDDGYGEHDDGSPFDGTGSGRLWPLLTGERGHYEVAAGRIEEAQRLLKAMGSFANEGGMISEQIWDSADIPEKELFFGRPSGSAMPLVWAHSEYIKLVRSIADGRVFDMPPQTYERYVVKKKGSPFVIWRFNHKVRTMPKGNMLRIEVLAAAKVHWGTYGWQNVRDDETRDTGTGIFLVDLPVSTLPEGATIDFTFYWLDGEKWEGNDFTVTVEPPTG